MTIALPALAAAAVALAAAYATRAGIPFSAFSRDPVTELHGPFYVGWLSHAGAVLWCVAAAACLFGWAVVRRAGVAEPLSGASTPAPSFLLASGLLSALLMADDLFLLHDGLFPHVLHVGERKTLAAYGLLVGAYLFYFRRDILVTRWATLAAAFAFFVLSLAFDAGVLKVGEYRRHMFEDGFKLVGIACWCAYFVRTALEAAGARAGPAHGHAPVAAAAGRDAIDGDAIEGTTPPVPRVLTDPFARIDAGRAALTLAAGIVLLLAAHTAGQWVKFHHLGGSDSGHYLGMIRRFDMNAEANVPTWYASALLLLGAALAAYASLTHAPGAGAQVSQRGASAGRARGFNPWHWPLHRHWLLAAGLLLLMSLDESAELHEKSIVPLRKLVGSSPWLYYPWVIPAALLVLAVAVASLRFLGRLPLRTRRLLLASAVTYVTGALGLETLGGWYDSAHGAHNFTYTLFAAAEETLEMAGTVLFVYAMLEHLRRPDGERAAGLASTDEASTRAR